MKDVRSLSYVLKEEMKDMPEWLKSSAKAGRVKKIYVDDEFVGVKVLSGTKSYEAKVGDVIMLTKSGLTVISKEGKNVKAKKEEESE